MNRMVYLEGVSTLAVDRELCTGCGVCVTVCPQEVLEIEDGSAEILHLDACMECHACATNCEPEAITVQYGVGCAAAVINAALGRQGDCCCVAPSESESRSPVEGADS